MKKLWVVFVGILAIAGAIQGASAQPAASPFAKFVNEYFDVRFEFAPSEATAAGFHQYDAKLEDLSAGTVAREIAALKGLQKRLDALRAGKLTSDESIDAEMIDGAIRSALLDLETLKLWRSNPMGYIGLPGGAIDGLIKRNFAPPAERLRSVVARLKAVPAVLFAMRANIENPPKEFTDLAYRMAAGSVGFFEDDVARWAKESAGGDGELLKEFTQANAEVVKAMKEAADWLKNDLLPRSKGSYAIGAENFSRKLRYEEGVDLPLDRLLAIGEANLAKDHAAFIETAKKIDPAKSPIEVMKSLSSDHPTEDDLIPSARRTIEGIRRYLIDKKIVSLPSEVRPTIMETPPYARSGSFASMDTPGAYETKATEAYYYVTPVEKDWDAKHKDEHLRGFNAPVMDIITIHEAFPGHYVQFLYAKQFPTKTRKLLGCGTNIEGWAHYTEQMMVEEGFGGGDPKVRLAQLSEALLRDCRFVVGIKLHIAGMSVEEGAKVFVEKGFQEPANAYEESRRGAYNPTYLYYTLGKLQIYKLREDYRKARGERYSIESFHNDFVSQGGLPIGLLRRILLPGDTGATL